MSDYAPNLTWRPLPGQRPTIVPTQFIVHTAVSGAASLWAYFARPGTTSEAHAYIRADGTGEQYRQATVEAWANGSANRWRDPNGIWRGAFSCETWDGGDPNTPWTAAQLDTLSDIALWLNTEHGVPLRLCTTPTAPGLGFHSMWPAPNPWSPGNHTCPGPVRIAQFRDQLLPLILRKARPPMACNPTLTEIENYVAKSYQAAGNPDQKGPRYWVRTAGAASDPFAVFTNMDKALGLQ